jgi:TetR/AcrR family transcriptional regulator, transcriptional repressor for nem operon
VNTLPDKPSPSGGARSKLLEAAISIIRKKGYAATSVDELCAKAGVTKGAFFHHFPSKDSLAVAAANHWSEMSDALFAAAPYHQFDDPLDRVLGYLDFRKVILRGEVAEFTCLAGTMVQEAYETHPDIRRACDACIGGHAAEVASDIADAMKLYHLRAPWTAESLALHTQAVLQGAFILAKAKGNAAVVEASIDHLRRYIELLFRRQKNPLAGRTGIVRSHRDHRVLPRRAAQLSVRGRAEVTQRQSIALHLESGLTIRSRWHALRCSWNAYWSALWEAGINGPRLCRIPGVLVTLSTAPGAHVDGAPGSARAH